MTSPTEQAWAIRTRDLRKTYQRGATIAVAGLDLAIPRGGVHGFLGPNGSGKTTTLRMLLGLARPDGGTMEILGEPVPERLPQVIDRVGAIVESPKFFATMSGRKNLALLAQAIGVPVNRVGEVLEQVGLAGRAKDLAGRYSLGMKQRLAIAATLLKDPELLIFDEPTNGLDPAGIHEVRATMRALAGEGKTVVVSSHILAEVQQVADTVSIIARGRLLRSGSVAELAGGNSRVRLRVRDVDAAARLLLADGYEVQPQPDGALVIRRPGRQADAEAVARVLGETGVWPSELGATSDSLEQVFLDLTRDEQLGASQFRTPQGSGERGGAA